MCSSRPLKNEQVHCHDETRCSCATFLVTFLSKQSLSSSIHLYINFLPQFLLLQGNPWQLLLLNSKTQTPSHSEQICQPWIWWVQVKKSCKSFCTITRLCVYNYSNNNPLIQFRHQQSCLQLIENHFIFVFDYFFLFSVIVALLLIFFRCIFLTFWLNIG